MTWAPTQITDVLETFGSSTRPLKVLTDEGPALLKYMGNRMGDDVLSAELISAKLLRRLGVFSPEFSVLPFEPHPRHSLELGIQTGPAFLTKWYPNAVAFSGGGEALKLLKSTKTIANVVTFDTWIRNKDRFVYTEEGASENNDNLLLLPDGASLQMALIDHSQAISETSFDVDLDTEWYADHTPHGFHPTFATFLKNEEFYQCLDEICGISESALEEIVCSVPHEWEMSSKHSQILIDGLMRRRNEMREWLPNLVLAEPELGLGEGIR